MRADEVELTIHGRTLRVLIDDTASRASLAAEFGGRDADDDAPIAFAVREPTDSTKLHVVMDRSGFVLGRTRSGSEALGILRRHFEALAPRPAGAVRLKMRALRGDDGTAVLAGFPLFTEPAPVERRLSREGFRLVDRLSIDIGLAEPSKPELLPSTDPAANAPPCLGHAASPDRAAPIDAILIPGEPGRSTPAQVVTMLAEATADDGTPVDRLHAAESLAQLSVRTVDQNRRTARYDALKASD